MVLVCLEWRGCGGGHTSRRNPESYCFPSKVAFPGTSHLTFCDLRTQGTKEHNVKIPRLEQVLTFRNFTLATKLGVAGEKTDQRVGPATKKGQETGKVNGGCWGFSFLGIQSW